MQYNSDATNSMSEYFVVVIVDSSLKKILLSLSVLYFQRLLSEKCSFEVPKQTVWKETSIGIQYISCL